jgi:hypothetical protein
VEFGGWLGWDGLEGTRVLLVIACSRSDRRSFVLCLYLEDTMALSAIGYMPRVEGSCLS